MAYDPLVPSRCPGRRLSHAAGSIGALIAPLITPQITLLSALLIALPVGCTQHDDHDHGHEHEHHHGHGADWSYGEAVEHLEETRQAVASAFAAGNPGQCDQQLHEALELLARFGEIAADTDLDRDDWTTVRDTAANVLAAFQQIDRKVHSEGGQGDGGQGNEEGSSRGAFDVSEMLAEVDQGLAVLQAKRELTGETRRSRIAAPPDSRDDSATSDVDAAETDAAEVDTTEVNTTEVDTTDFESSSVEESSSEASSTEANEQP